MRTAQPLPVVVPVCKSKRRLSAFVLPAILLVLTDLAGIPVARATSIADDAAKVQQPETGKSTTHKTIARSHKRSSAKNTPKVAVPVIASQPVAAPQPPKPNWPMNDGATQATIIWNATGLRIEAANASLRQILQEVSTLTGSAVEGMGSDERVYGVYGPGPVREVLAKLFYGSGYNLLLIGDSGQGTPRQVLLTRRDGKPDKAATKAATSTDDDDDVDVEPDAQAQQQPVQGQPPQVRNSSIGAPPQGGPGGPGGQNSPQQQDGPQ